MQQMEWREALEDARWPLQGRYRVLQARSSPSVPRYWPSARKPWMSTMTCRAVALVRALMFVERFAEDIDKRCDQLPAQAST
jgi:hypothetical protein